MTGVTPFIAFRALLNPSGYPRAPAGTMTGLGSWFLEKPVTTWCVGSALVSVILIGLSTLTLRAGGLGGMAGGASGIPWHRRLFRLGAKGSENRPPRNVWANPIAWREAAARNATMGRIIARWSFIAIGALFGIALVALLHTGAMLPSDFRLALLTTVWGEAAIITLVAINMASTAVSREREDGTLDLLLTTPITPGQYITGKLRGLVAYLLPMIAVPVGTVGLAGIDVIILQAGNSSAATVRSALGVGAVTAPTVLPEALIVSALSVVPFIAACVMIGLQWSLKSKGTIGSVIATVGVVGVLGGIVGLCGWRAGAEMSVIGPVLSAMSPATALLAAIYPAESMANTVSSSADGLITARISLFVGSVIAVGVYAVVIYGIHSNMTRTFDFTVRKLAGTA
jgi:ABC-type transport system involved in multi-copper enzyme maturation permease subunit